MDPLSVCTELGRVIIFAAFNGEKWQWYWKGKLAQYFSRHTVHRYSQRNHYRHKFMIHGKYLIDMTCWEKKANGHGTVPIACWRNTRPYCLPFRLNDFKGISAAFPLSSLQLFIFCDNCYKLDGYNFVRVKIHLIFCSLCFTRTKFITTATTQTITTHFFPCLFINSQWYYYCTFFYVCFMFRWYKNASTVKKSLLWKDSSHALDIHKTWAPSSVKLTQIS